MKKTLIVLVLFSLLVSALIPVSNQLITQGYKHRDQPWAATAVVAGGRIRMYLRQFPEARGVFETALQQFAAYPRRDKLHYWIARCYENENNSRQARVWYANFLTQWPTHSWANRVRERDARLEAGGL
ncbi:MAG: hypothetical protein WCH61_10210 [bacterium]